MARQQTLRAVKGMRDILPPESALWSHVEEVARNIFRSYAYQEIRTPLVEPTELFARGVGTDTDIVTKEMYTWEDRDKSSLTLRPEATASVIRAYIEHRLDQRPGVKKFYYMGPMFRRERPQKGRYRQFYQIGAEAIGSESPRVDAEVIEMLAELLKLLGIEGYSLLLNSVGCKECRLKYLETLRSELAKVRDQLCEDCQRRSETNPLRVLDCKVPADQPVIDRLPMMGGSLCEACRLHFDQVQDYLRERNIAYTFQPRMVRGLDYYTRTTFEFVHGSLGAQNSFLGGGRYDGLSEELGGPSAPGVGFSVGEDRLVMTLLNPGVSALYAGDLTPIFVAWVGENAHLRAVQLARELRVWPGPRGKHFPVFVPPDAASLSKLMGLASRMWCRHVLIIGDQELAENKYILRDMVAQTQNSFTESELFHHLKELEPEYDLSLFLREQSMGKSKGTPESENK